MIDYQQPPEPLHLGKIIFGMTLFFAGFVALAGFAMAFG